MALCKSLSRGSSTSETLLFDDLSASKAQFNCPRHLRALRVWELPKVISGLQAFYDDNTAIYEAELHLGQQDKALQVSHTVFLDDDEYFIGLTCKTGDFSGPMLSYMELETNKRKKFGFGDKLAAQTYAVEIPSGHVILAFHGGIAGYLHHLGVFTRPWLNSKAHFYLQPESLTVGEEFLFGNSDSDTVFADFPLKDEKRQFSLTKVVVKYNRSSLCKVDLSYRVNGRTREFSYGSDGFSSEYTVKLKSGEEIIGLSGRGGNFLTALEILTTNETHKTGTSAGLKLPSSIPPGYSISRIVPGVSGNIQCLLVSHQEKLPMFQSLETHSLFNNSTVFAGEPQSYSSHCDDVSRFIDACSLRLHTLYIYHCSNHIYGFGNKFLVDGKPVRGGHYIGPDWNTGTGHQESTLKLQPGEFLVCINVKVGLAIDGLQFVTSFDRVLQFGDTSPPLVAFRIPSGNVFSALAGGIADPNAERLEDGIFGQLHYVKAYYGLLNLYKNFIPIHGVREPTGNFVQQNGVGYENSGARFDYLSNMRQEKPNRLAVLSIAEIDGAVARIQARYLICGRLDPADQYLEDPFAALQVSHLFLAPDEFVVRVTGSVGVDAITSLAISTNKGQDLKAGKFNETDETCSIDIPNGHYVVAFEGKQTDKLTFLSAWTSRIPEVIHSI